MPAKKKKNQRAHRGEEKEEEPEITEEKKTEEEEGTAAAAAGDDEEVDSDVDPRYPLNVVYCPVCGMPPEFCEYGPSPAKCFSEHPELHEGVEPPEPSAKEVKKAAAEEAEAKAAEEAKVKTEGGETAAAAAAAPTKGKKKEKEKEITMTVAQRSKRKFITTIVGLDLFDVKLAEISKLFSKRFACGSTVAKNASMKDVVEVQGDVCTEVAEILVSKYNIPQESIFIVHGKEKTLALP